MAEYSFDVVSEFNPAELTNAVDQARREVATRFDFKDTATSYDHQADLIQIVDAARNVHDDVRWTGKEEPLCRVAREGAELQVMFGEVAGPLSGGGTFVIVRKTPDGYRADNRLGVWRS